MPTRPNRRNRTQTRQMEDRLQSILAEQGFSYEVGEDGTPHIIAPTNDAGRQLGALLRGLGREIEYREIDPDEEGTRQRPVGNADGYVNLTNAPRDIYIRECEQFRNKIVNVIVGMRARGDYVLHCPELCEPDGARAVPHLCKKNADGKHPANADDAIAEMMWKRNPIFQWHQHYPEYIHHRDAGIVYGDGKKLEYYQHFWRNAPQDKVMEQLRRVIHYLVNVSNRYDRGRTYAEMVCLMKGLAPYRGWDNAFCGAHGLHTDEYADELKYLMRVASSIGRYSIWMWWAKACDYKVEYNWRFWEAPEDEYDWSGNAHNVAEEIECVHHPRITLAPDQPFAESTQYRADHFYRPYEAPEALPVYAPPEEAPAYDELPAYEMPEEVPDYDSDYGFMTAEEGSDDDL